MGQCLKSQSSSRTELSGFDEQEEGQSEIADPRQDLFSVDLFREFCVQALSHHDVLASVWQGLKMYVKRWRTLNY